MNMLTLNHTLKKHVPRFLREDYMPYDCKVGAIKENYDWRARMVHAQNPLKHFAQAQQRSRGA